MVLPPKSGTYANLQAVKGKLLYRRSPRAGAHDEKSPIAFFDLEAREEKTVLDDAEGFEVTFDGKKMLVAQKKQFAILDVKEKQSFEKPMISATSRCPSSRAPNGARFSWTPTASSATSSTTRACTA